MAYFLIKTKNGLYNLFQNLVYLLFLSLCFCENPISEKEELYQSFIDENLHNVVVGYFENDTIIPPGVKTFVYFNYFGIKEDSLNSFRLFVRCRHNSVRIQYNQVFEYLVNIFWSLNVIYLEKFQDEYTIKYVETPKQLFPPDSIYIKEAFPQEYHDAIFNNTKDPYNEINRKYLKNRIIEYCKNNLANDRFIYVKPPSDKNDIHNHREQIYSYLNLNDAYEYTKIIEVPENAKNSIIGNAFGQTESPDGRFQVLVTAENSFHTYFKDNDTDKLFEIVNPTSDMLLEREWKDNRTLVFDQLNGYNRFDERLNTLDDRFGIHFEIDLIERKIIWAVPFGYLSFPEKIEN